MKEYVLGFYFFRHEVALVTKLRPSWQRGRINGIVGKIEKTWEGNKPTVEPIADAMVREFMEEAGKETLAHDWKHYLTMLNQNLGWKVFVLWALGDKDGVQSMTDEQVSWHDVRNLPSKVIPNLRWMIPLALDKDIRAPVLMYDEGSNG